MYTRDIWALPLLPAVTLPESSRLKERATVEASRVPPKFRLDLSLSRGERRLLSRSTCCCCFGLSFFLGGVFSQQARGTFARHRQLSQRHQQEPRWISCSRGPATPARKVECRRSSLAWAAASGTSLPWCRRTAAHANLAEFGRKKTVQTTKS